MEAPRNAAATITSSSRTCSAPPHGFHTSSNHHEYATQHEPNSRSTMPAPARPVQAAFAKPP